jgi:hypothetical protein
MYGIKHWKSDFRSIVYSCHPDLLIVRGILMTPGLRLQLNSFILLCIVLKTDRDIVSGSFCCFKLYYSLRECHGYWEILPNYAYMYQCIHIVTFCPTYIPYMNQGIYIYILWLFVLPTYMLSKNISCDFLSCDFLSARVKFMNM